MNRTLLSHAVTRIRARPAAEASPADRRVRRSVCLKPRAAIINAFADAPREETFKEELEWEREFTLDGIGD